MASLSGQTLTLITVRGYDLFAPGNLVLIFRAGDGR